MNVQQTQTYAGVERLTHDGSAKAATLPANAEHLIARLTSEGADTRYAINATATATSTFLPENESVELGPLSNLDSISTFGAAGFTCIVYTTL